MPRCEQGRPQLDVLATTRCWAATLLGHIARLAAKEGSQPRVMLEALLRKCRKQAHCLADDGTSWGAVWADALVLLGSLGQAEARLWHFAFVNLQAAAAEWAAWAVSRCAAGRRESWDTFLEETSTGGAGLLHRLTKGRPAKPPLITALQPTDRVDPLNVANFKMAEWARIWLADEPVQDELPRERERHVSGVQEPLSRGDFNSGFCHFQEEHTDWLRWSSP
jgi:hypothetical protein